MKTNQFRRTPAQNAPIVNRPRLSDAHADAIAACARGSRMQRRATVAPFQWHVFIDAASWAIGVGLFALAISPLFV